MGGGQNVSSSLPSQVREANEGDTYGIILGRTMETSTGPDWEFRGDSIFLFFFGKMDPFRGEERCEIQNHNRGMLIGGEIRW